MSIEWILGRPVAALGLALAVAAAVVPGTASACPRSALSPAGAPPIAETELEQHVEEAIDRGVAFLRANEQESERRGGLYGSRPGRTALVVYALLSSGVDGDDPLVRECIEELSRSDYQGTYDSACLLLALTRRDADEHRAWIEELTDELIDWQRPAGDWGYPEGRADLSNTQFAALGLRAAAHAGVEIPDGVWERMARCVMKYSLPDGAFSYSRSGRGGTNSMTAAGVGTLAICDERLTASGALTPKLAKQLRKRRERGLAWLAKRMPTLVQPSVSGTSYYTMYGIERVGAFEDIELLGEVDWYMTGAEDLVGRQNPEGGWGQGGRKVGGDAVSTSFALLFLRRATRTAVVTGSTQAPPQTRAVSDPNGDVQFVADGETPTSLWITGFSERVRERFEWPEDKGRGPRVVRVEYLAGGMPLATLAGDASRPVGNARFATQIGFDQAGTYTLRVRVVVMRPPHVTASGRTMDSTPAAILSPELEFKVGGMSPAWLADVGPHEGRNVLSGLEPRLEASSTLTDDEKERSEPRYAVDGRARTSWLAEPDDKTPTLVIRLGRVREAHSLLVSNAQSIPYRAGYYTRAAQVEVRINDGPAKVVAMPPDERRPGRLEFERPTAVRKIELRLLWPVAGENPSAGLCEVELIDES